ncbi:hypothetical protein ACVQ8P_05015 [Dellaglioa sp. BT-FLS60]
MQANNQVRSDFYKVAVQRRPIIYATEQEDTGSKLWTQTFKLNTKPKFEFNNNLLGGVTIIRVDSMKYKVNSE